MRSNTNQAVQLQKMARGLKLRIEEGEVLYYLCSEIKGAVTTQLINAFVFAYSKSRFCHDAAHVVDCSRVSLLVKYCFFLDTFINVWTP